MTNKPGSLMFDNPEVKTTAHPGAVVFQVSGKQNPPAEKRVEPKTAPVKPLDFSNVVKPAVKVASAIFKEDHHSAPRSDLLDQLLGASSPASLRDTCLRQIRQLTPLTYQVIATWGQTAVEECANHTLCAVQYIKQVSEQDGNELLQRAFKAIAPKKGMLNRLISRKNDIELLKPAIILLKRQLLEIDPKCDKWIAEAIAHEARLVGCTASLRVAFTEQESGLGDLVHQASCDRLILMDRALQQIKMSQMQVMQLRSTIQRLLQDCDSLILTAIPAFEMIQAQE